MASKLKKIGVENLVRQWTNDVVGSKRGKFDG